MATATDEFVREAIKKALDNLGSRRLKEFKCTLVNKSYGDKKLKVPRSQMEEATEPTEVVDLLIARHTAARAVEVTVQALRDSQENQVAEDLEREAAARREQDERKRKSEVVLDGGPSRKMKRSEGENEGTESEALQDVTEETMIGKIDKYYLSDIEKFVDENREQLVKELQAKLDSDTFSKLKANLIDKKVKPLRFKGDDMYNIVEELAKELLKRRVKLKDSQMKKVLALLFKNSPRCNVKDAQSPPTTVTSSSIAATRNSAPPDPMNAQPSTLWPLSIECTSAAPTHNDVPSELKSSPTTAVTVVPSPFSTTKTVTPSPSSTEEPTAAHPYSSVQKPVTSPPCNPCSHAASLLTTTPPSTAHTAASSSSCTAHSVTSTPNMMAIVPPISTIAQTAAPPLPNGPVMCASSPSAAQKVAPFLQRTAGSPVMSTPTTAQMSAPLPPSPACTTFTYNTASSAVKSSPTTAVTAVPFPCSNSKFVVPYASCTHAESPLSTSVATSHPRNSQTAASTPSSSSETIGPFSTTTKITDINPTSSAHEDSTSPTVSAWTPAASPPTNTSHPTPEQTPSSSLTSSVHTTAIATPKAGDSVVLSAPTTAQSPASPLHNAFISNTSSAVTSQTVAPFHSHTASTSDMAPTAQTAALFLPDSKPTVAAPSRNTAITSAPSPNKQTAISFALAVPFCGLSFPGNAPLVSPLTVKQDGASENDLNPSASLFSSEESFTNGSLPHSTLHSPKDLASPDSLEDELQSSEEDLPPENEKCQPVSQKAFGNARQARATKSQLKIEALKKYFKDRAQEVEELKKIQDLIESVENITERVHKQYHCLVAEDILIYKDPEYGSAMLEIKMPKTKKTSEVPIDKCKDFGNVYTKQGNLSRKEKFLMMFNMGVVESIFMTAVYFRDAKDPLVWYPFSKSDFKTFTDHFKKCFFGLLVPVIALYKDVQREQLKTELRT